MEEFSNEGLDELLSRRELLMKNIHYLDAKKEVCRKQKKLKLFVLKHKEAVSPFTAFLMCARKIVKKRRDGELALKQLDKINDPNIKRIIKKLFMDLVDAIEKVPVDKKKSRDEDELNRTNSRDVTFCPLLLDAVDPKAKIGMNPRLISYDQLLQCTCGKPYCHGLMPIDSPK